LNGTTTCVDCEVCREPEPNNFKADQGEGMSHVLSQPPHAMEEAQLLEAMAFGSVETTGGVGGESSCAMHGACVMRRGCPFRGGHPSEAHPTRMLLARRLRVPVLK
jgi:hypothetical protein